METINPSSIRQLRENWGWYFALGIGLIILGTLALIYSFTSTIFYVEYLGFLLIALGVIEAIQAFKLNFGSTFFLHVFLSLLYICGGIFFVMYPLLNALTLTLALAFFFIISGIAKIFLRIQKMYHIKVGWL